MKILTTKQILQGDSYTIEKESIKSVDLMERAATNCALWIMKKISPTKKIHIFCGKGNNGGDGLVISRLLTSANYSTAIYILAKNEAELKPDVQINYKKLKAPSSFIKNSTLQNLTIKPKDIIIDALFGIGINTPFTNSIISKVITIINQSKATVISIDLPSGMTPENKQINPECSIIKAKHTLTLESIKLNALLPENEKYSKNWHVISIGWNKSFTKQIKTNKIFVTKNYIKKILKSRSKFSHKDNYGSCLLVAGSKSMAGAALLAVRACVKSGSGKVFLSIDPEKWSFVQSKIPECILTNLKITNFKTYTSLGIGPGITTTKISYDKLKTILENYKSPMIIDADGINLIAQNQKLLNLIPKNSILTPHMKEFNRLIKKETYTNSYERLNLLQDFANKHQIYIVLKGAHTITATPDKKLYFNSTGNPGMATAGSGDVLFGLISGLKAQGYSELESCLLGVYIHGKAGDESLTKESVESLTSSEIINYFSVVFKKLKK